MTHADTAAAGTALERRLSVVGVVALAALVALVAGLRWIVPLEDALWRAILLARDCRTDALVEVAVDLATPAAALLVGATLLYLLRREGLARVWPLLAVIAVGALANTVLKEVLTRERPSMLPDVAIGHGFPSGHVMNTAIAALLVVVASARLPRARWWRAAGLVLLAIILVARVLAGRHWPADVTGALLAATAFVGLALRPFRARPLVAPAAVTLVLLLLFATDRLLGAAAASLPSPLSMSRAAVVAFDARRPPQPGVLAGGFGEIDTAAKPLASIALQGTGTVTLSDLLPAPALLAIAVLPPRQPCTQVTVRVNAREVASFIPFIGWREYRLPLRAGTLALGTNVIEIAARHGDDTDAPLAIAYARIMPVR